MRPADLQAEAFRAFSRWLEDHDPEGNMDLLDAASAYAKWAEGNSIEKYLDNRHMEARP